MTMFLKDNAMLFSGLLSAVLTVVFAFSHFDSAQTAALVGIPSSVGNVLAHLVIRASNGRSDAGH